MRSNFSTTCDCLSYDLKPKNNMQIHSRSRPKHKFVSWQNTVNPVFTRRTQRAKLTFIIVLLSFAILISFVFIFLQLRIQEGKKKEKKKEKEKKRKRRRKSLEFKSKSSSSKLSPQARKFKPGVQDRILKLKIESLCSKLIPGVQERILKFKKP